MLSKTLKTLKTGRRGFTLVEIMIVVLIIGILLAIAIPNFVRAREQSRAKSCSANLKQLSSATTQWAMDNKLASTAAGPNVTQAQLSPTYIKSVVACPSNGVYAPPANLSGATDWTCNQSSSTYPHSINGQ